METGRIHIEDSLDGKRRESGRSYWRSSSKILIIYG
jgi:hypothetical protein